MAPELIEALKHKDSYIRSAAAITLGMIGPAAKDATPALIAALEDRDSKVRTSAATALWQIDQMAHDVMPALLVALKDRDAVIRVLAAEALAKRGPETSGGRPELVLTLIETLKDPSVHVRRPAAGALAQIRPIVKEAIPGIVAVFKDDGLLGNTEEVFARLGREAPDDVVPALIAAFPKEPKDNEQHQYRYSFSKLAHFLGRIGPEAKAAEPLLVAALEDPDRNIRLAAAEALKEIRWQQPKLQRKD